MEYEQVYAWVKVVNLINNRVSCINWLLRSPDGSVPVVVKFKRGSYRVCVSGSEFARFGVYDSAAAESAFVRVSALYDGLWLARRSSLTFT